MRRAVALERNHGVEAGITTWCGWRYVVALLVVIRARMRGASPSIIPRPDAHDRIFSIAWRY